MLSLSTRPIRLPRPKLSIEQRYGVRHLNRIRSGLGTGYAEAIERYRDERRMLQRRMTDPGEAPFVIQFNDRMANP